MIAAIKTATAAPASQGPGGKRKSLLGPWLISSNRHTCSGQFTAPPCNYPAKRTFTLADVAEALYGPGSAAIAQGALVAPAGQAVSQPAMPAWMEVLNNILKKLGHEGQLQIMTTAVVVFPPSQG